MSHRILYVNHSAIVGGGEVSLLNLLRRLDRSRYAPTVVCPVRSPFTEELGQLGVPYLVLPFSFRSRPLALAEGLVKVLRTRGDSTIVHGNSTASLKMTAVLGLLLGAKTVWHVRDLVWDDQIPRTLRLLAKTIDCVVANSKAVRQVLQSSVFGCKTVRVIHNAVDCAQFHPGLSGRPIRDELGISVGQPVVGIVGRLTPWKGHRTFLEALQVVKQQCPNFRALIVGETYERSRDIERRELDLFNLKLGHKMPIPHQASSTLEDLKILAHELGLQDQVIFTGFRRDIPLIMAALDVLVLASWAEPFGRVLIEAMAMEKPVIATASGAPPEIIEDGKSGILVPPLDAAAMAAAIVKLLNDPALGQRMGRYARSHVERRFSLSRQVREIEALYDSLC